MLPTKGEAVKRRFCGVGPKTIAKGRWVTPLDELARVLNAAQRSHGNREVPVGLTHSLTAGAGIGGAVAVALRVVAVIRPAVVRLAPVRHGSKLLDLRSKG